METTLGTDFRTNVLPEKKKLDQMLRVQIPVKHVSRAYIGFTSKRDFRPGYEVTFPMQINLDKPF